MWTKLLLGISLPFFLWSQSLLAEQFRVGPLYEDGPGEVSVVVELPYGITPAKEDFQLRMDRQVVKASDMKTFLDSGKELAWLLCVDVSGTMAGRPLKDIRPALHSFLAGFRPGKDRFALMTFGTGTNLLTRFQDSYDDLIQAVANLKGEGPKSKTMLYQTLFKALNYYEEVEQKKDISLPGRKRILLISDGKDEGSAAGPDSVIKKSKNLDIPIDAVGRGRIPEQYRESLARLASSTGGRFVYAEPGKLNLTDALSQIYEELMKTRTVVVYFKYAAGSTERLTEKVDIELQQPSAPPLSGSITARIPLPAPVPPLGCDLRMMSASHDPDKTQLINQFKAEFESKKDVCAVLIVAVSTNAAKEWTVAGYNDAGEFKTASISDPNDELAIELKKAEGANRNKLITLAKSKITSTPPPPPVPMWIKLLVGAGVALLLTGLVAVVLFGRKKAKPSAQPQPTAPLIPPKAPVSVPEPIPAPSTTEERRLTQVGGYFPPPGPGRPSAILVGVSGPLQDQQFPIEKEVFRIGGNPENDLAITDDDYVSGDHAYLRYEKGSLLIFDQGSRNGTFVNNNRLTDSAQTLTAGDRLRVGTSTFEVIAAPGR